MQKEPSSIQSFTNLRFWVAYLALNFLLFLPLYLLSTDGSTFWPALQLSNPQTFFKQAAQFRDNFDIFRLNVEFAIVVALWGFFTPRLCRAKAGEHLAGRAIWLVRGIGTALHVAYLLMLYYYIYEAITLTFFLVDPIFYNQYFMARDGLTFLWQHVELSPLVYVGAGLLFIGLHLLLWRLLSVIFARKSTPPAVRLHWGTTVGAFVLAGLAIASVVRFEIALANPVMVASSVTYKLKKNITESMQIAESVGNYQDEIVQRAYDYSGYRLTKKPHIYLLAIESYGSVLYKRPHFRSEYLTLLDELDADLTAHGWHAASNLSTSPTWGGGSWMAYGSLLFGIHIDVHPKFLFMRNKYRYASYPDIGRYLKSQGYRYFQISSMSVEVTDHEWAQYIHYYGVDEWLRYRDMNYTGARYSFGPSPPDQYTLGFIEERMEQVAPEQSHFTFLITQNSHYPWAPLPQLIDDWRDFNSGSFPAVNPAANLSGVDAQRANYLAAIKNQLEVMVDFITRQDEDAIFVLVGDHQPPRVARRDDGFETPMHIIGRDPALVDALAEYGFQLGLNIREQTHPIKHEGFYSMFMRVLVEHYGEEGMTLPPYLPNGVIATEAMVEK